MFSLRRSCANNIVSVVTHLRAQSGLLAQSDKAQKAEAFDGPHGCSGNLAGDITIDPCETVLSSSFPQGAFYGRVTDASICRHSWDG